MEEKVFFDDGYVKVTNARVIVPGKTYALASVNSFRVNVVDETPNREIFKLIDFGLVLWGLFVWLSISEGKGGNRITLVFICVALILVTWWGVSAKRKIKNVLVLSTSSGEVEALFSYQPGVIQKIEDALGEALVYRG